MMLPPHFPDCYKKLKKWIKKRINIVSTNRLASNENERIPNASTTLNGKSTLNKKLTLNDKTGTSTLNEETVISALNEERDTLTQKTDTSNEIILSEKTDNEEERNTPTTKGRTFNSLGAFSSLLILNSSKMSCLGFFSKRRTFNSLGTFSSSLALNSPKIELSCEKTLVGHTPLSLKLDEGKPII
ncbi:hypothetical protein RhiirB3_484553 [Rhizophagus irregularis]|nr:hypothetical protein RhiirB3_484553 [Rhizophagus irregularis]